MRALAAAVLAALAVAALPAAAVVPADAVAWDAGARAADKAYWDAYNRADPAGMNAWLARDVEFYHDRAGKVIGKKALSAVNDGMRKAPVKLRRELVPGSEHFFPMRRGDTLYGAVVTGEHRFYAHPAGAPETLLGHANYSHLMLLEGGTWRIARIFSYEHMDAPASPRSPIEATADFYAKISARDLDGVAQYLPAEGFTEFPLGSDATIRLARENFAAWFKTDTAIDLRAEDLVAREFDDTTIVTGMRVGSMTPKGQPVKVERAALTMVWVRTEGRWQIRHVHLSAAGPATAGR